MPRYLLSAWRDDRCDLDNAPETQRRVMQLREFNASLERAGAWVFGVGLGPASSATAVRATGGHVSMTDGPYAATHEQMRGLWIIEAPDLDSALDWALRAAAVCDGPVEVRPTEDPWQEPDDRVGGTKVETTNRARRPV